MKTLAMMLLLPLCASLHAADKLSQLQPSAALTTNLLDGRLSIHFPESTQIEAMQEGIMSAPESSGEQTRAVIDAGEQRMVIMTYERFALAGTNFENEVQNATKKLPFKVRVEAWPLASPLHGYAYFPVTPTHDERSNLVMGLYVVRSDGTVQELQAYINPDAAAQFDSATALAKSIFKTITEGKRALNFAAGDRELFAYSKEKAILVTLPAGYVVIQQQGPDFLVHHIRKITALGTASPTMGVYLGENPSHQEGFAKKVAGHMFGKTVEWQEKTIGDAEDTYLVSDALVSLSSSPVNGGLPSYADVFLSAKDSVSIEELRKIAATLRVVPRQNVH